MKARISVEYLTQDPGLCTNFFAKYTYDPTRNIPGQVEIGRDDTIEVVVAVAQQHRFPFRSPQVYYGDICQATGVFLIIMEEIPFSKNGTETETKPYEILPLCGKCQDHLLPNPADYYLSLFRAMGQMGGWDKLGHFDSILGPAMQYNEEAFLKHTGGRAPRGKQELEMTRPVVGKAIDTLIDFFMNWCMKIVPPELRDAQKLHKIKEEVLEMSPYFGDMSTFYQSNNSDYIVANHTNPQADNAFFWLDEYGDMACGCLDWGGFSRGPLGSRFLGCLTAAEAELLMGHLEGIIQCFVDEYERCGGPALPVKEIVLRYHLALITNVYDSARWLDQTKNESTKEDFLSWTGLLDPGYQERFYTRCGSSTIINTWAYYAKMGTLKTIFDDWANGAGKQYLSEYG